MTDEGQQGEPLDEVEALNAMRNMASLVRTYYESLTEAGFKTDEAMKLVLAYVHGMAGGKLE